MLNFIKFIFENGLEWRLKMNKNVTNETQKNRTNVIAGRAWTHKRGQFVDTKEDKLIVFKGYRKIKKLKYIENEEYFRNVAEKFGWTIVYDFDWCDKGYETYDRACFENVDEENGIGVLKDGAKCFGKDNQSNIVVWAAYKKFSNFDKYDIEGCLKPFDEDEKKKYKEAIRVMSREGKYCWIAYVCGNSYARGIKSGVCDSVEEFMKTDFEVCRNQYFDGIEIGGKELGWKSVTLRDFGDRGFDCKLSKMGASKCAVLQELKRIRSDIKECSDILYRCGWYSTEIESDGDYHCERIKFEKLLMGGEYGVLKGQVVKLGSGRDGWKFQLWHDVSGILGGVDKDNSIGRKGRCAKIRENEGCEYWCRSKWLDEGRGYCWLGEDEMEGWIGLIRGLKKIEEMVEKG